MNSFPEDEPIEDDGLSTTTRQVDIEAEGVEVTREFILSTSPVLIVIRGIPQGKRFALEGAETFVIGRGRSSSIQLDDANVSREHARITIEGDRVQLEDMGSRNGTLLNDEPIGTQKVTLAKEDMIRIGHTILKFLPPGQLETLYQINITNAAHRDALTSLFSRQYISEVLEVEFKRAKALHTPMSVVFFDIDDFKKVNDNYGHTCGDQVLTELGGLINGIGLRKRDIAGRTGGEEFLIVLANTNLEQAAVVAERVRKAIDGHKFQHAGTTIPVTVSLGVATIRPGFQSGAAVYEAADQAMYESKRAGKNRVTVAS
jgi:diguanylate cyclase (GGDEF)-like protein